MEASVKRYYAWAKWPLEPEHAHFEVNFQMDVPRSTTCQARRALRLVPAGGANVNWEKAGSWSGGWVKWPGRSHSSPENLFSPPALPFPPSGTNRSHAPSLRCDPQVAVWHAQPPASAPSREGLWKVTCRVPRVSVEGNMNYWEAKSGSLGLGDHVR